MSADPALAFESIAAGLGSADYALSSVRTSFLVGIALFLVALPFCKSPLSFFDAIAARKVTKCLRLVVFLELVLLSILLNFYLSYGNAIQLHAVFDYGNGDSWLFGYARPVSGFVFIIMGLFADMHPAPRLLCLLGAAAEIVFDALSAVQVLEQYRQLRNMNTLSNGYSLEALRTYFWRDIVSIAVCTLIFLFAAHLTITLGVTLPQRIHPSLLSGQEYDRYAVFHIAREKRKLGEARKAGKEAAQSLSASKSSKRLVASAKEKEKETNEKEGDLREPATSTDDEANKPGEDFASSADKLLV